MQHLNNFILFFYLDWYQGCWLFGAHWPWSAWVDYWWSSNWQNCRCHRHHYQPKEVQWWNRGQKETDVHLRCYRTKEVYRGPNRQAFDWRRCHEIHVNILILIIDIFKGPKYQHATLIYVSWTFSCYRWVKGKNSSWESKGTEQHFHLSHTNQILKSGARMPEFTELFWLHDRFLKNSFSVLIFYRRTNLDIFSPQYMLVFFFFENVPNLCWLSFSGCQNQNP